MKLTHREGLDRIVERLKNMSIPWETIETNVELGPRHHLLTECDVIAIKGNRLAIFEYKSGCGHCEKAYNQLDIQYAYFHKLHYRVSTFYVHENDIYERIWRKE